MKADELMVGDIVLRKGKPVEIVSTSGITYSFGQQDITIYQGKGNGLEAHTMRGVAPMRMSEKLLLAIGFSYGVSPNEWIYEDSEKRIDISVFTSSCYAYPGYSYSLYRVGVEIRHVKVEKDWWKAANLAIEEAISTWDLKPET